jgi:hypothetical protein
MLQIKGRPCLGTGSALGHPVFLATLDVNDPAVLYVYVNAAIV